MRFDSDEFYLKTPEEMAKLRRVAGGGARARSRSPSAATSRSSSATLLPHVPVPDGSPRAATCAQLARAGAARALRRPRPEAIERLEFELGVIEEMGFAAYFLIVWDFVHYAKENGVAVGPGRGSAAGSIVAYCLGITDVDPLAYDLLFERFLNPARKSMPDIDIDFSVARPRARDPLRRREVRPRVGRADHHLRHDGAARRRSATPRACSASDYGTGDRLAKHDPGADHGPQHDLRGVPEARAGAAKRSTTPSRTRRRSSTSPRASRGSSATTRSTPPRS